VEEARDMGKDAVISNRFSGVSFQDPYSAT